MNRAAPMLISMAIMAAACSNPLGRTLPECTDTDSAALAMMMQSVPGAEFIPCLNPLEAGWEYNHAQFRSGLASFTLDSDRMGDPFLEVTLAGTCPVEDATATVSDEGTVPLFMNTRATTALPVVVIPEGLAADTRVGAGEVAERLRATEIHHMPMDVSLDLDGEPTAERVQRARDAGAVVVVVGLRDYEEGTVTLIFSDDGEDEIEHVPVAEAIDELGEHIDGPSYEGVWYYPFDGGCVTYTFTARGPGVETIQADVQAAIDLRPVEPLRELATEAGVVLP